MPAKLKEIDATELPYDLDGLVVYRVPYDKKKTGKAPEMGDLGPSG